ncbi:MAG: ATP-binding protein [Christensenellaceae bacterium]|nr:ATP-binding protein [Christensenellaceae bacterium]
MNNTDLFNEIYELISLGTEGSYWDFKQQWHENNADLLHDIICMANNFMDRDAYIIIGVSDSKSPDGVQIKGVPDDNRKSQQNLIDFLKDKKFAGSIRPTVYVQTLNMGNQDVDVIIVKNTADTPYFLTDPFNFGRECVRAGHIYVRIGDTNTPKIAFADIDKVEYLWRKRFGIDLTVNERLLRLLDSPDDWAGSLDIDRRKYHSVYPEFQIHLIDYEESENDFSNNSIVENLADHNPDKKFSVSKVEITYHSTVLFTENVIFLDGYRHLIPFPATSTVYLNRRHELDRSLTYLYFDNSTILGKLYVCLANTDRNWYGQNWDMRSGVAFLQFDDASDREAFDVYVEEHLPDVLVEYRNALTAKGYIHTQETQEYFIFGWSKANEIKSKYLYEKYRGIECMDMVDFLPTPLPRK